MRNVPAFLLLLCLVAALAQFNRQPGETPECKALRQDMVASLNVFWKNPRALVEITPDGHAAVRLHLPVRLRERQKRWTYPFLRFVARRHPDVQLQSLEIFEAGEERKLPELSLNGLLACRTLSFSDSSDERKSDLVARQLTADADRELGAGRVLFLADVHLDRSSFSYGLDPKRPIGPANTQRVHLCAVSNGSVAENYWKKVPANLPIVESFRIVQLP